MIKIRANSYSMIMIFILIFIILISCEIPVQNEIELETEITLNSNTNLNLLIITADTDYDIPTQDSSSFTVNLGGDITGARISYNTEKSTASAILTDSNSIEIDASNWLMILEGDNNYLLTVTAENGDKQVYTINIHRDVYSPINQFHFWYGQIELSELPSQSLNTGVLPGLYNNSVPPATPGSGEVALFKIQNNLTDRTKRYTVSVGPKSFNSSSGNIKIVSTSFGEPSWNNLVQSYTYPQKTNDQTDTDYEVVGGNVSLWTIKVFDIDVSQFVPIFQEDFSYLVTWE